MEKTTEMKKAGTTGTSAVFSHKERWAIEHTRANQLERQLRALEHKNELEEIDRAKEIDRLRETVARQAATIRKLEGDVGQVWGQ